MAVYIDQMGRSVELPAKPKRIISIVPSQTELLVDLGLSEELVGITKFCVHPEAIFRTKTRIGGTKLLNIEKIKALQPDLIIGNKEENQQEQVQELMQHFPVWMSDIADLPGSLDMIIQIGEITGKTLEAGTIANGIRKRFDDLADFVNTKSKKTVAYFIWKDPYMTIGNDTFISDMLGRCGLINAFNAESRYPVVSAEDLSRQQPSLIFLSSEPYPFKEKHIEEFKAICPGAIVKIVDGEMFSWYGSRLLQAPAYFNELLSLAH